MKMKNKWYRVPCGTRYRCLVVLGLLALSSAPAFAETVELVTYYPAPGGGGDLHADTLTVGSGYAGVTPNDGEAFIENLLSVGSTDPVNITTGWGAAAQRTKLWLEDNTAGIFPALVITGGTAASGGGGAVQFVDTAGTPIGDFGAEIVGVTGSQVGIAARRNNTGITFYTTPAGVALQRMVVLPSGNIGIGTPNPLELLHLVGANDATSNVLFMPGADTAAPGAPDIRVGIGVTNPSVKLELPQNTALKLGNAYLSSGGDYAHLANNEWYNGVAWQTTAAGALIQMAGQYVHFYRHDAAGNHAFSGGFDANGRFGIGTGAPNATSALDVVGRIRFGNAGHGGGLYTSAPGNYGGREAIFTVADGNGNNADEIWIGCNTGVVRGNINLVATTVTCQGTAVNFSDARMKTDIAAIPNALERVSSLRGVNFHWKDRGENPPLEMGVIGQEVEQVFPELVRTDPKGMKSVSYTNMNGALIEAIKELKARNDAQQKEINELKERLPR